MRATQMAPEWRWVYGAIVFAAAALFFYSIHSILSPLIAYVLLLVLLAPYRGTRRHTTLLIAATLGVSLWLLAAIGTLLVPFLLAFALAYILDPAVDALQRRGVGRTTAVALLVTPVLLLLTLAVVLGVPALVGQLESLLARLPAAAANAATWVEDLRSGRTRVTVPFVSHDVLLRWLDEERIAAFVASQQEALAQLAWSAAVGVGRGIGAALSILGFIVLTPVLLIYMLRDFDSMTRRIGDFVPERRREQWVGFAREYDALLSRFLRGQVVAAAIVGVLTWLGLLIAGVPFSGLVGLIAGVFNLVPYLGLVVSIVPILIIALLTGSFVATLVKAGIVFAIVQAIDGTVTGPRIVGTSVGLHPVWVILALAVAGAFFGVVGLLIAVPAAVLIKLMLREMSFGSVALRGAAAPAQEGGTHLPQQDA